MRTALSLSLVVVCLTSLPHGADAQNPNPLVGAWERISLKDSAGADVQPPAPVAFTIFTADGFYSQISIPTGRPKLDKPLADYTKEELLARFNRAEARRGKYTVSGNTLSRTYDASLNTNTEGAPPQVQRFRVEGDILILSTMSPANKAEARFRRAK